MIFIAGASGFVGGHLVDSLLSKGHKVKCLARSKKTITSLTEKGSEVVSGDITQAETLQGVLCSDDIVIHLVGIIEEKGLATFRAVHVEGTRNLVAEAKQSRVRHFFFQSALGADLNSWSGYFRTKAEAEEIVRQSGIPYTLFRPSLIIGPWDGFTKKIMDMLRFSPVIPLPGEGKAKLQPIYIKDWLKCMETVIEAPGNYQGSFDIGGSEHLSYRQIVETLSRAMGHNRLSMKIPMGIMKLGATIFEKVLSTPPVSSDQLHLLEQNNICAIESVHRQFGFMPMKFADALQEFML